jgi:hypothetical protein
MISLTKKEQHLGLLMLSSATRKTDQNIYISHAFYSAICKLKKYKLIESIKKGRNCDYKLTDDGRILFSIMAKFKGNEEYEIFSLRGTRIIYFS